MHARIVDFDFKTGKQDEALKTFEQVMADVRRQQSGFRGSYLLGDAPNNKGLALVLFDSESDIVRTEETGFYAKQIERFRPTLSKEPQQGHFKVGFNTAAKPQSGQVARVVRWATLAGKSEQAIERFQDATQAANEIEGFRGAYLLFNTAGQASLSITFWESEQQMKQTEESGWWQKQVDRFKELMEGAPTREHYELLYTTQAGEAAQAAQKTAQPEQPQRGAEK